MNYDFNWLVVSLAAVFLDIQKTAARETNWLVAKKLLTTIYVICDLMEFIARMDW